MQLSTLTLNCTNAIFHNKTRHFECFAVENLICVSVNTALKLRKCEVPLQNTCCFGFTVENQLCASPNSDVKLHKCNNPPKTRIFECVTVGKPICETVNSDFKFSNAIFYYKHVFFSVLRWKTRFVQVSTDNSDLKINKCGIPLQNTSFFAFYGGISALFKCQLWL